MSIFQIFFFYIKNWDNLYIDSILSFIQVPNKFVEKIKFYNELLINNQINHINYTIDLIEMKQSNKNYQDIIDKQIQKAKEWCNTYDIDINSNSYYLKK